jgi:YVTN family beta-propeller protein
MAATASSTTSASSEVPKGPRVYVSNETSGDVTVIDLASNKAVATVKVGKRPRGIQHSPDGKTIYVALSGSVPAGPGAKDDDKGPPADKSADGIGVIDAETLTLTGRLPSGSDPEQFAVSKDGTKLYISNEDAALASIVGIASKAVETSFAVGEEPEGVAASPDGHWVYVTSEVKGIVYVIDTTATKLATQFAVGARPRAAAFLPDTSKAYVTAETGGTVSVVALPKHKVIKTLKLEGENVRPMGVVVSPDGKLVYVTTGHGGTVVVIDTAKDEAVASIPVGKRPWGIAVTPDGKTLYVANGPSDDVSVVDTGARKETARIKVGSKPWGITLVP